MKTASAKAKGRRGAAEIKALMHKYAPKLQEGDIIVTPSGVTGPDLFLSPAAFDVYPYAVESKNSESISVWKAFEQAQSHVAGFKGREAIPTLFFKRNRSELMVCLRAEDFFKLTRK